MRKRKAIAKVSSKERDYKKWLEEIARPFLIEIDGNYCACCGRPARIKEKLDIDHIQNKGSRPDLKKDLNNLQLLCRFPCHRNKTDNKPCLHTADYP